MYTSRIPIPLYFLLFSLVLHLAIASDPLYHSCFSQDNYTTYSPFSYHLHDLLNLLSARAPPTGFGLGSTGQGRDGYVNGLALCRGDVSRQECKSCVVDAGKAILDLCPNKKGAIIWYDECMLKYSSFDFFGKIDEQNKFYLYNVEDVDYNPALFNSKVKELLGSLSIKANLDHKFFATGKLKIGVSQKLYGLVQCTRDLSNGDCHRCLDGAIGELLIYSSGKKGGRVVGGSCNVRYELYPFA